MNKMKKITATAAAMAISAGLAVGGTLAYLNSVTETKTNTFTSGKNITTTLTETEWTAVSVPISRGTSKRFLSIKPCQDPSP